MLGRPGPDDLWGKLREDAGGIAAWHRLEDHCIDVAGVLEALLQRPVIRRRLARAGGREDLDEAQVARLCFLAFLHDLGKCSLGFRAKAVPALGPPSGHLAALRPLWTEGPELHAFLAAIGFEQIDRWAGEAAEALLLAVFAHHGRRPDLSYSQGSDAGLLAGWRGRQREPFRRLAELVATGRRLFAAAFEEPAALPATPALQHLFAGLLMLADWLGSADEPCRFPYAEPGDPPREAFVRARAPEVLRAVGLVPPAPPDPLPDFRHQHGFAPRPAQAGIDRLPLPDGHAGSVVLLEAETGSGKTEAAFRWASRLIDAGLVDGCFFAVPLRSAAVQLQGRMQRWLDRTYGQGVAEALLAVPGYYRMGEAEGRALPGFAVQWTDDETTLRHRARWAAEHPKRYAAASFAVGTIDQALLGALQVRHAHLRAACLVRHLLVIDEVHASDAYMTALAERLLTLFRACGGHVLLMSATLGAETRARLVEQRRKVPPFAQCVDVSYPRITASHAPPLDPAPEGEGKTVELRPLPAMADPEAVAAEAARAVRAGARVLVLRNTVRAAIATQMALEEALGQDHPALFRVRGQVTLHHGRFAAEDRRLLDEEVAQRFHKDGPVEAAVVVATQTLEQSLDLDGDLLITDLCPVDVLLQRIGRLHRHPRSRPPGFEAARCLVLVPEDGSLESRLTRAQDGIGPERAYANVLAVEATRRMIEDGAIWTIPHHNRRLVEEGTHPDRLQALADAAGPDWAKHWSETYGTRSQQRSHAYDSSIDFEKSFADLRWPDSAEKVATRLGAADLLLPLERPLASPFGSTLTHLKVPRWMTPADLPEEPVLTLAEDGGIALGERRYRYDRFGLQ